MSLNSYSFILIPNPATIYIIGNVIEHTVKPRPEAHMDMILFEEYPLDSTSSDSTTLSIL